MEPLALPLEEGRSVLLCPSPRPAMTASSSRDEFLAIPSARSKDLEDVVVGSRGEVDESEVSLE